VAIKAEFTKERILHMKKFFGIILMIFLMATLLCVSVSAAQEPAKDIVLRVRAETKDDTTVVVSDYSDFEDGWNYAMDLASSPKKLNKNGFKHIIIDIYTDWNATDGNFTEDWINGAGFKRDTIYFPKNVDVTLNLNGHTINRGLSNYRRDGEVIYIAAGAEVAIRNGTIKGGWSSNGAGCIHVAGNANVTLVDVNITGNSVENDNGGAIALYNGATLTMRGGSISDNFTRSSYFTTRHYGAGLYASDSTAVLHNVNINNNQSMGTYEYYGAAIYAKNSDVTLNSCQVKGNGIANRFSGALSIIHLDKSSTFVANNTTFSGNSSHKKAQSNNGDTDSPSVLFFIQSGTCYLNSCTITENRSTYLLKTNGTLFHVTDTAVTNNQSIVLGGNCNKESTFTRCTFQGNTPDTYTFEFATSTESPTFVDCTMNNSTYNNKSYAKFKSSSALLAGSIFNENSMTMIIAVLALVASVASICVTVICNKKKTAPAAASDKSEDDE
jgi:hypothetical protein